MNEVQRGLLKLLKEIDQICRENDIDYYLAGGSLIGAVRHGGFLPWDDDADIHMTRDNAEKFRKAVDQRADTRRLVVTGERDRRYMDTHWRYQDTETTTLFRSLVGNPVPQGQFVDIFTLFPLPVDETQKKKCLDTLELYTELKANNAIVTSLRSDDFIKKYQHYRKLEKKSGYEKVWKQLEDKMYHFSEEEAEEYFIRSPKPPQRVCKKEWWGKPRYVPFEDTVMPVPSQAEKFLAHQYGTLWFELPALTERQSHTIVTDLDINYKPYVQECNRYEDTEEFFKKETERKEKWFDFLIERNVVNKTARQLQGLAVVLDIQEMIRRNHIDARQMLKEKQYDEIDMLFQNYFAFLGSKAARYWGVQAELPDDLTYAAIYRKCFAGSYGIAKKILNYKLEINNGQLSDELMELYDICNATDKLLMAVFVDKDLGTARNICKKYLAAYDDLLYFMRADIYLDISEFHERELEADDIKNKCLSYLEKYPNDGELLKYMGDICGLQNDKKGKKDYYQKAQYSIRNGLLLKEIKMFLHSEIGGVND